jgi:hypothetical protein
MRIYAAAAPPIAETRKAPRPRRNDDAVIAQYIQDLSRA